MHQRVMHQTLMIIIVAYLKILEATKMIGFVIGGEDAKIISYPHSVFLEINGSPNAGICGGSILNQDVILTAAHCFDRTNYKGPSSYGYIKYGSANLKNTQYTKIVDFKKHERYEEITLSQDIALVRCKSSMALGRTTKRVSIMMQAPKDKIGYVAGWGVTDRNAPELQQTLQNTVQEIQSSKTCRNYVGSYPPGTFCAGPISGPGHPAIGDSGSALVIQKYIQVGIVSFKESYYSLVVYTNVSYHYSWITSNVAKIFCAETKKKL